jgi:hypothetical protein
MASFGGLASVAPNTLPRKTTGVVQYDWHTGPGRMQEHAHARRRPNTPNISTSTKQKRVAYRMAATSLAFP